jgi:hypothetical protein
VLSSPVFAKPHLRPPILIFPPRVLAPRAGSYDTNYLGFSFTSSISLTSYTSSSLSPLESALTSQLRVLPCFGRNRPPATPLESASTGFASVNSLESASTKNMGGGGWLLSYELTHTDSRRLQPFICGSPRIRHPNSRLALRPRLAPRPTATVGTSVRNKQGLEPLPLRFGQVHAPDLR